MADQDPLHLPALLKSNLQLVRCANCSLSQTPGCPVPAISGSPNPKVLLVGEAPGATEAEPSGFGIPAGAAFYETGRPFVGFSGKKLRALLAEVGFDMPDISVSNAVKHRPPNNRTPTREEYQACSPFLLEEIRVFQPKRIIALGAVPSRALAYLAGTVLPSGSLRGKTFDLQVDELTVPVLCTWHPAYAFGYKKTAAAELREDLEQVFGSI